MNNLLNQIETIAQEEGFKLVELKEQYKNFYISVDSSQGDRCVDDRSNRQDLGNQYPYDKGNYNGRQFPGGTLGILGALRVTTGMNEEPAKNLLLQVYRQNNFRLGDHIDDQHGEITDPQVLITRNLGCGNQDKIKEGKIAVYRALVQPQMVDQRFDWLRKNNSYLPVLTGHHAANQAVVNLVTDTTYNNNEAVKTNASVFNLDLAEAEKLAKLLYQSLTEKTLTEEEFRSQFVQAVIRDYLQTLKALTPIREIQLRK